MTNEVTVEELWERLEYDPLTGIFIWTSSSLNSPKVRGKVAGSLSHGRIVIRIQGRSYLAHRLAWLMQTGSWPQEEIDHRNRKPADNRWVNLREATHSENQHNRTGAKNVYWSHLYQKWVVILTVNGQYRYIGGFYSEAEAQAARNRAKKELHLTAPTED